MSDLIHPTAIVEDGAVLGDGCRIGPYCHIGPMVRLGDNSELKSHVAVAGDTTIGANARIFPFASVGHEPQDLKYAGEHSTLVIGDNCLIREGVTMNPGTKGDRNETKIGNHCVFLANSHVAHDCVIGDHVIFSNAVLVAGHCKIGDHVIFGGGAGVHQFCRIGNNAFVGGMAGVDADVIPFGMALGNRAYLGGLNLIGMKRANFDRENIHRVRKAFKQLFTSDLPIVEELDKLDEELSSDPLVSQVVDFIRQSGDRALCTPKAEK